MSEGALSSVQREALSFLVGAGCELGDGPSQGKLFEDLEVLRGLLEEKNKVLNLTSISSEEGFWFRHCVDSLSLLSLGELGRVLDWGTGGGFPGLPLALARRARGLAPDVIFLDSVGKKLAAVREFALALGLPLGPQAFLWTRGESLLESSDRPAIDTIVMRAVAPPERARRWVDSSVGRWVLMLGPGQRELWLKEEGFLRRKGLVFGRTLEFSLPGGQGSRSLLEISSP